MESKIEFSASDLSYRCFNPIRQTVDKMTFPNLPNKPLIPLSLGDPTFFGNLVKDPAIAKAVFEAMQSTKNDGYIPAHGTVDARLAIANYFGPGDFKITQDDVFLTHGCSGALDLALSTICNPGDKVLIPSPGFSLYTTLISTYDLKGITYPLVPEKSWECDMDVLEKLVSENKDIKMILINNPSNPCGSVFSLEHLKNIVKFASTHNLVILADEVYWGMTFSGSKFYSVMTCCGDVPVVSVGGLAKRYLVPGWRIGWAILCDRKGIYFPQIRKGMLRLSQKILGPCSLLQAALPAILKNCTDKHVADIMKILEEQASYCIKRIKSIPSLEAVVPQGAMYLLVRVDLECLGFKDDLEFFHALVQEENVMVLPGSHFQANGFIRVVICAPIPKLEIAFDRIKEFCEKHSGPQQKKFKPNSSISNGH